MLRTSIRDTESLEVPGNLYETFKFLMIGDTSSGKSSLLERFVNNEFHLEPEPTEGVGLEIAFLKLPKAFEIIDPDDDGGQMEQVDNLIAAPSAGDALSLKEPLQSTSEEKETDGGDFVKLQVNDLSGDEQYSGIIKSYRHSTDVHGIIIVFDVRDRDTYASAIKHWLKNVQDLWLGTFVSDDPMDGLELDRVNDERHAFFKPSVVLVGNACDCAPAERQVSTYKAQQEASRYKIPYVETSAKTGEHVNDIYFSLVQDIYWRKYSKSINADAIRFASRQELSELKRKRQAEWIDNSVASEACSCELNANCTIL